MEAKKGLNKLKIYEHILEGATKYTSRTGKLCYRSFSSLNYYLLRCEQLCLSPKCANSLLYEAENEDIELDWCEEDLILHFKHPVYFIRSFYSDWQQVEKEKAQDYIIKFIKRSPSANKKYIKDNFMKILGE